VIEPPLFSGSPTTPAALAAPGSDSEEGKLRRRPRNGGDEDESTDSDDSEAIRDYIEVCPLAHIFFLLSLRALFLPLSTRTFGIVWMRTGWNTGSRTSPSR